MNARNLFFALFGAVILITIMLFFYAKQSYKIFPVDAMRARDESASPYLEWQKYTPLSNAFTVMMPLIPQHATEKITDKNTGAVRLYNMYVAEKANGTIFMVNLITFVEGISEEDGPKILNTLMEEIIGSGKDIADFSLEQKTFKKAPSLNFSYTKGGRAIHTILFRNKNIIYMLSSVGSIEHFNPKDFVFFTESFEPYYEK
jgi:hypothetical protein